MVEELIEKLRRHPKLGSLLFWLEDVSDADLDRIYGACSCLIAASEGEGFGLPLIEAANIDCRSWRAIFRCFAKSPASMPSFFKGRTPEALAEAVRMAETSGTKPPPAFGGHALGHLGAKRGSSENNPIGGRLV